MPTLRTDIVDLYLARRPLTPGGPVGLELLQLRRSKAPLLGSWQPIMGHIEPGETALQAATREAAEEVGLALAGPHTRGLWQLEQTFPFFIAATDTLMISPRFVALLAPDWQPTLNHEHDAHRWVNAADAQRHFTWPGQLHALREIELILSPGSLQGEHLRIQLAND